jgi:hypothetical protein
LICIASEIELATAILQTPLDLAGMNQRDRLADVVLNFIGLSVNFNNQVVLNTISPDSDGCGVV